MKNDRAIGPVSRASNARLETVHAESSEQEQGKSFEDIRDRAPVAYFSHDQSHRVHEINQRAMNLFGLGNSPRKELTLQTLISEKSLALFEYHLRRAVECDSFSSVELTLQANSESPVTVFAETSVVGPGKFQTVMVDISARKQIEFERNEFDNKIQQSQKLEILYQLSGGIAHDFNNLLQVLEIQVDAANKLTTDCDDSLKSVIAQIRDSVDRGSRLTRRVLTFSRQGPLEKVRGDLNEFVKESIAMIDRAIGDSMEIRFQPAAETLGVWIDPVQLEQLLFNLCLNARDASDASDGNGVIDVQLSAIEIKFPVKKTGLEMYVGPYTKMTVSDQSGGIPETLLNQIFEPFVTSKDPGKGTGLGLSIVHNILKQHEGAIEISETSPVGTTFDIYFPRFRDSSVLDGIRRSRVPVGSVDGDRKKTILVADDEKAIRDALHESLTSQGIEVLLAKDGAEAIELLDRHPEIAWVLTDLVMPVKGGLEVCEYYRSRNSTGTVVLMSGHGDSVLDRDFLRLHNATYLQKPFDFSKMKSKLGLDV